MTCPNCQIEMDSVKTADERTMVLCGICAYGWYVDSKEDE